jgi:desulfoferrodoxin (superoxide reductase-like protein)
MKLKIGVFLLVSIILVNSIWSQNSESTITLQTNNLDYAQVEFVELVRLSPNEYRVSVTVLHNDEGWDHYADAWQIVNQETGEIIAERILAHPHDNEQPFTRSINRVRFAETQTMLVVRAKCNIHGFGGREVVIDMLKDSGEGYQIK